MFGEDLKFQGGVTGALFRGVIGEFYDEGGIAEFFERQGVGRGDTD